VNPARKENWRRRYESPFLRVTNPETLDAPMEMLEASPITPGHVIAMRQRQEQFRRQQEEAAQRQAEDWAEAWRDEEARSGQAGYCLDQDESNKSHAYPSARSGEQELRRILLESGNPEDRELAKSMFPWLKLWDK
jgi:hypothetical protein